MYLSLSRAASFFLVALSVSSVCVISLSLSWREERSLIFHSSFRRVLHIYCRLRYATRLFCYSVCYVDELTASTSILVFASPPLKPKSKVVHDASCTKSRGDSGRSVSSLRSPHVFVSEYDSRVSRVSSADRTAESSYGKVWWSTYVEGKPPIRTCESHTHRVFRGISRERWCRTRQRGRKRGGGAEGCAKLTYTGFSAAFGRNFYRNFTMYGAEEKYALSLSCRL